MTGRSLACAGLLLLLGACHKSDPGAASLDAGADLRNQTAARTLADLDAADRASSGGRPRAIAQ